MTRVSQPLDRIEVIFDDENLVANAGLLLSATLVDRLGLEATDRRRRCSLVGRVGGARPGRKVLTLAHSMIAGGSHIDHADAARRVERGGVGPSGDGPSTLGTFLRAFTFGHVRQLEAVNGHALERAWAAGAGPRRRVGDRHRLHDLRSRRQSQAGRRVRLHEGARLSPDPGDTGRHRRDRCTPGCAKARRTPNAVRAGSSTNSSPASDAPAPPVRSRCGSTRGSGPTTPSPRSSGSTCATRWRSAAGPTSVAAAIAGIDDDAWVDIDYTRRRPSPGRRDDLHAPATITRRLIVRRTRLTGTRTAEDCGPTGDTTPSSPTSTATPSASTGSIVNTPPSSSPSATSKKAPGSTTSPPGKFHANSAWLQCAVLAHNLTRWTAILGDVRVDDQLVVARSVRTRLIALPGRLVNRSGRPTLRMPSNWPWATRFITALEALRALRPPPADRRPAARRPPRSPTLTTQPATTHYRKNHRRRGSENQRAALGRFPLSVITDNPNPRTR